MPLSLTQHKRFVPYGTHSTDVKEEMGMLSQEGLDILTKQQEILDKIRDSIYDKGETISELQENVIKITG